MVHSAILGSIERFLGVYIEHTTGRFPLWLAPEQLRIALLNDEEEVRKGAEAILAKATEAGLRATIDDNDETVGKKIRNAELMKVPYTVVIGGKELESGKLSPRSRQDLPEITELTVEALIDRLAQDVKDRK